MKYILAQNEDFQIQFGPNGTASIPDIPAGKTAALVTDADLSAQLSQVSADVSAFANDISAETVLSAASFGEWVFTQAMLDAELTVFSDTTTDFTLSIANKALLVGDYNSATLSVTQNGLSAAFYSSEDPYIAGDARWTQIGFKVGDVVATRQAQSYVLGSQTDKPLAAAGGSFTQVQADWNEADASSPAYIQNKPTIPSDKPQRIYNDTGTDALDDKGQLYKSSQSGNYWIVGGNRQYNYAGLSEGLYKWQYNGVFNEIRYNPTTGAITERYNEGTWYTSDRGVVTAGLNPVQGDEIPSLPNVYFRYGTGAIFTKLDSYIETTPYACFALESMPNREYSNASTYTVGDIVKYHATASDPYKAYRCNTRIAVAEAWTAAHWTEIPTLDGISATLGDIETALHTINYGSSN